MPALVSPPVPVPRILGRLLPEAVPSSVSPNVAPVMVPVLERMILPAEAFTVLAAPSVSSPL